jgi:lysophospholipid acyltransferase (LPLAT)-like uncharacterized protein
LNPPEDKQVYTLSRWQKLLVLPLVWLVRLWTATLRLRVPEQTREIFATHPGPLLFVVWHNRLFTAAAFLNRYRPHRRMHALVSASRDGAWLAAFFEACGLAAVRGSSSRMGPEAARSLVGILKAGEDAGITPDGPRGPVYEFKPGALVVARTARPTVALCAMDIESAWRLRSWDGFYLPKPFSRVTLTLTITDLAFAKDREEGARALQAALIEMNPDRIPAPVRRKA